MSFLERLVSLGWKSEGGGRYVLGAREFRRYEQREGNAEHHDVRCDVENGVGYQVVNCR